MNILVTGSPGVGKTLFSQRLKDALQEKGPDFELVNLSELVKAEGLYDEYDDHLDTLVKKRLKQLLAHEHTNFILETHTPSLVPRKPIDLTFVLRTPNTALYYDRLAARGYPAAKIEENVDCEIMQVVWMEAVERWGEEDVTVIVSETSSDLEEGLREALEIILSEQ